MVDEKPSILYALGCIAHAWTSNEYNDSLAVRIKITSFIVDDQLEKIPAYYAIKKWIDNLPWVKARRYQEALDWIEELI